MPRYFFAVAADGTAAIWDRGESRDNCIVSHVSTGEARLMCSRLRGEAIDAVDRNDNAAPCIADYAALHHALTMLRQAFREPSPWLALAHDVASGEASAMWRRCSGAPA